MDEAGNEISTAEVANHKYLRGMDEKSIVIVGVQLSIAIEDERIRDMEATAISAASR